MNNKKFGSNGEDIAVCYLKLNGFNILARNYTKRFGEIDIISQIDDMFCFIEVKTRQSKAFGEGREAVDLRKQGRIARAAAAWIQQNDVDGEFRFDVIEVFVSKNKAEITHITDAFYLADIN